MFCLRGILIIYINFLLFHQIIGILPAMLLGELVQKDRERAGLTQEQLASKLNSMSNLPLDPFTKNAKVARRTWIAKVESGLLQRDLRLEVREWIANALGGDLESYRTLPHSKNSDKVVPDSYEDLERCIRQVVLRRGKRSQFLIDTPVSGPLAGEQPHLLSVLVGILTINCSDLIIFSNEYVPNNMTSSNTMQTMMMLYYLTGQLAESSNAKNEEELCKHFEELDWDENIILITNRLIQAKQRGECEKTVMLNEIIANWLRNHLFVYTISEKPSSLERYNPLTNVLVLSFSGAKRGAYALSGYAELIDLPDPSALAKVFDERRPLFKKFQPSTKAIIDYAALFGLKLEAVQ